MTKQPVSYRVGKRTAVPDPIVKSLKDKIEELEIENSGYKESNRVLRLEIEDLNKKQAEQQAGMREYMRLANIAALGRDARALRWGEEQ